MGVRMRWPRNGAYWKPSLHCQEQAAKPEQPGCPRMCLGMVLLFGVNWPASVEGEEVWKHYPCGSLSPLSLMWWGTWRLRWRNQLWYEQTPWSKENIVVTSLLGNTGKILRKGFYWKGLISILLILTNICVSQTLPCCPHNFPTLLGNPKKKEKRNRQINRLLHCIRRQTLECKKNFCNALVTQNSNRRAVLGSK